MDKDTIKVAAKFNGTDKYNYENYCLQTLAMGGMKGGWNWAYLQILPVTVTAATTTSPAVTQDEVNKNIKLKRIAWNYLVLLLDRTARNIAMQVPNEDPREAWIALENRYKPRSIEAYTKLCIDFKKCNMERPNQDPKTWIMTLHKLNNRMNVIDASYRKPDTVMISHILSKLPDQYGMFNTSITLVGYSQMMLRNSGQEVTTIGKCTWRRKFPCIQTKLSTQPMNQRTTPKIKTKLMLDTTNVETVVKEDTRLRIAGKKEEVKLVNSQVGTIWM